jgi:Uma2 family endonuclease
MTAVTSSNSIALPAKFSVDDYHRMIDAGILADRRVELIEGLIVEMSPESDPHIERVDENRRLLEQLLGRRARVREGHPIALPASEPEPDLAIVRNQRYATKPKPEDIYWLIEGSVTSLAKDKRDKRVVYASAGIPEYWVLDGIEVLYIIQRSPQSWQKILSRA